MAQFGNTEIYGTLSIAGRLVTRDIVSSDNLIISNGITAAGGVNISSGGIIASGDIKFNTLAFGSVNSLCLIDSSGKLVRDTSFAGTAATIVKPSSATKGICYVDGSAVDGGFGGTAPATNAATKLNYSGEFYANKVYNAYWNDIADFVTVEDDTEIEFGKAYTFDGKHRKTNKYAEASIGIASDTYGFGVGSNSEVKQIPIAIGGFVLAYVDNIYKFGTPLVATRNGKLTKADLFTKLLFPERIVATFYKEENKKMFNTVEVKNRHWVKI